MRRFLIALTFVLAPAVASAQNITVRDIIELSKAGLNEQALVALVEVNPTVFPVDVDTLKKLTAAGVPASVITAMIRSGRTQPMPPAPAPAPSQTVEPAVASGASQPAPQVVVIEHRDEPQVREVQVPVYVAVPVRRVHGVRPILPSKPVKPAEPVFWGFGGKLRPDAWKPSIELPKDARIEIQKK